MVNLDMDKAPDPRIRAEAAVWIARIHSDRCEPADEMAFRAWLAADPRHRRVFERMTETWDVAGSLNPYEIGLSQDMRKPTRRRILLGIGATMMAGGGVTAWNAAFAGVYETGVGERREIGLDDGSRLTLDTETKVRVAIGRRERSLKLRQGRIALQVATDTTRPFHVAAGNKLITADSGMMDVRLDREDLAVSMIRGRALVAGNGSENGVRPLTDGQRLIESPAAAPRVDTPDLRRISAWQNGQAIFDGDTLAEAVAEMNRYNAVPIAINDPAVASLRISGVYQVGDTAAFADSIAAALPVHVRRDGARLVLLAASDRGGG